MQWLVQRMRQSRQREGGRRCRQATGLKCQQEYRAFVFSITSQHLNIDTLHYATLEKAPCVSISISFGPCRLILFVNRETAMLSTQRMIVLQCGVVMHHQTPDCVCIAQHFSEMSARVATYQASASLDLRHKAKRSPRAQHFVQLNSLTHELLINDNIVKVF